MHDQRIVRRAPLGAENLLHRDRIQGVGPQAVYGFRWKPHQRPAGDQFPADPDGRFIGYQELCQHQ